ncbi:glutathione Stransferase [Seminavis robusta]|uniref:Glutathione Stransferase n=1 Tax=Seminavis robusta TaxID=568900 RepID=A0A9N8DC82_9STRA|nr:glutathione Stransferase [Seminavis robusta]|eukprot:Sro77_g042180.1 glutathione Stransferase (265) ;mRNA; f:91105-91899
MSDESAAPAPTLYHVPRTISSPIYQALLELDLVNNPIRVETLSFPDLKTPEHLARNPMGTSPTFVDAKEGIDIWESGAVMMYLLEAYDTKCVLHPDTKIAPKRDHANYCHLCQYVTATVYPFLSSLFLHTLEPADQQDPVYLQTGRDTFKTKLGPTLAKFLGDKPFFMGDKLSAVDLLVAKPLNNAHSLNLLKDDFPTLQHLFCKIKSRPSFAIAYNLPLPPADDDATTHDEECCRRSMVLLPSEFYDGIITTRASLLSLPPAE